MKTAFLHGDLKEELYMDQPKGFEDPSRPNNVCRLLKCIYGLKQASRSWNDKFDKFLTLFGFVKSSADPCIYYQKKGEVETILAIWVDDGLLCGTDKPHLDEVLRYLSKHFEITSKDIDCFVGISIIYVLFPAASLCVPHCVSDRLTLISKYVSSVLGDSFQRKFRHNSTLSDTWSITNQESCTELI